MSNKRTCEFQLDCRVTNEGQEINTIQRNSTEIKKNHNIYINFHKCKRMGFLDFIMLTNSAKIHLNICPVIMLDRFHASTTIPLRVCATPFCTNRPKNVDPLRRSSESLSIWRCLENWKALSGKESGRCMYVLSRKRHSKRESGDFEP